MFFVIFFAYTTWFIGDHQEHRDSLFFNMNVVSFTVSVPWKVEKLQLFAREKWVVFQRDFVCRGHIPIEELVTDCRKEWQPIE